MKKTVRRILSIAAAVAVAASMALPVSAGWQEDSTGWWYSYSSGGYAAGGWEQINGAWYYFTESGYMKTGWIQDGGAWYYLKDSGTMHTGWLQLGNDWYYMDPSGAMATGTRNISGTSYTFNSSGVWVQGAPSSGQSSGNSGSSVTTAPAGETRAVYWAQTGSKYHIDPDCRTFGDDPINSGTIAQAKANGRDDWCGVCSKGWSDERLEQYGNPFMK